MVDCIADTLRLPSSVGDESAAANYTHIVRDKSIPQPKSQLPVLLESYPIEISANRNTVKRKQLTYAAVGFHQELANEASQQRKGKELGQKRARKFRRKLTKEQKLRKKYQPGKNREAILASVDNLDKWAQKLGAHVVLVDGVRKGKSANSRIQDKATILMHQLRQVGGIAAGKVRSCLGTHLRLRLRDRLSLGLRLSLRLRLRAQGPGLRAQGSGLRAQGSGLRAQGSGLGAQCNSGVSWRGGKGTSTLGCCGGML